MTGSKQQGLTIELSPAEMDALKQLAKDAKCNINGLAKSILVEQIKKRTDAKKPYFAFAAWPGSSIGGHIESRYLDTLDDVRAMVEEVSAKGAKSVAVKRTAGGEIDRWTREDGWLNGRVGPNGVATA